MRRSAQPFLHVAAVAFALWTAGCATPPQPDGRPNESRAGLPSSQHGRAPEAASGRSDGPLCERLLGERSALNLGAPLRARVDAFPDAARAWLERSAPAEVVVEALERLLVDPADIASLSTLHANKAAFARDPALLVDATLRSLTAVDLRAEESNIELLALLARARAWLPGEPTLPWIEALLVPEQGARRALLAEAFNAGGRDPALLFALARAAMRDGDSRTTLTLLHLLQPLHAADGASTAPNTMDVGVALRELAAATEGARDAQRSGGTGGVRVWGPRALSTDALDALAREVAADLNEAAALLGGLRRTALDVWVHADLDDLRAATCGASWSQALYDGVLHVVLVGPTMDAALRQSVRHEALHAQLDAMTPLAPRWFHEGVAQRFAGEPAPAALDEAADRQQASSFATLEAIEAALAPSAPGSEAGAAYAAARRTVDRMVTRHGDAVLRQATTALRAGLPPQRLSATFPP